MRTKQIRANKDDFLEFLEFACHEWSLEFSMNPAGQIWPSRGAGWSEETERRYIKNGPALLHMVAEAHADERAEGGRFRIDFQGAYSIGANQYFILWIKSKDLVLYERLIPIQSKKMIDLWAMMAKRGSE